MIDRQIISAKYAIEFSMNSRIKKMGVPHE